MLSICVGLSQISSSGWFQSRLLPCSVSIRGRSDYWLEISRIADHGNQLEVSAFLVIVWYTYRNKSSLKFSALVRTIIADATMYFLAMVALQVYIQVSFVLTEVRSLSLSLSVCTLFCDHQSELLRASINNFRLCEYTPNWNDSTSH